MSAPIVDSHGSSCGLTSLEADRQGNQHQRYGHECDNSTDGFGFRQHHCEAPNEQHDTCPDHPARPGLMRSSPRLIRCHGRLGSQADYRLTRNRPARARTPKTIKAIPPTTIATPAITIREPFAASRPYRHLWAAADCPWTVGGEGLHLACTGHAGSLGFRGEGLMEVCCVAPNALRDAGGRALGGRLHR